MPLGFLTRSLRLRNNFGRDEERVRETHLADETRVRGCARRCFAERARALTTAAVVSNQFKNTPAFLLILGVFAATIMSVASTLERK
jgi:hypothetical protein